MCRCAYLLGVLCCLWSGVTSKGVHVELNAGWKTTPLVAEAAEFLWDRDPAALWRFLEMWRPDAATTGDCWHDVHHSAASLLESKNTPQLLALSLAFRLDSPKVELKRTLTSNTAQSCCWVEAVTSEGVQLIVDPSELQSILQSGALSNEGVVPEIDFEYPRSWADSDQDGKGMVMLYGPIGSQCFHKFHSLLRGLTERGDLRYFYRPILDPHHCAAAEIAICGGNGDVQTVQLGGFGVELAIKNTEYIAVNEASHSQGTLTPAPEIEDIPVQHLGLQSMKHILESQNPLEAFAQLVQDFPSSVADLSKIEVTEEMEDVVRTVARMVSTQQDFALLNGLPIDVTDFDLLQFLDRLQKELLIQQGLQKLPLSNEQRLQLMQLRGQDRTADLVDLRFDILPTEHVIYLNDVEKDPEYRQFYPSLEILFSPFLGNGGLAPIRRNLFNAVFFVQLESSQGHQLAKFLEEVIKQQAPLHIGLVPMVPEFCLANSDLSTVSDLMQQFLGLYFTLGAKAAFAFWAASDVPSHERSTLFSTTFENFRKKQSYKGDSLNALESASNEIQAYLKGLQSEVQKSGMCDRGASVSLWLNGRLIELVGSLMDRMILYHIQLEMRFLQRLAYVGEISDQDTDLLSVILDSQASFAKYSPFIAAAPPLIQYIPLSKQHFGKDIKFVADPEDRTPKKTVSHWVVGQVASKVGVCVVRAALEFILSPKGRHAQIAFLPTFHPAACGFQQLWRLFPPTQTQFQSQILQFWMKLLSDASAVEALLGQDLSHQDFVKSAVSELCQTLQCSSEAQLWNPVSCQFTHSEPLQFPGLKINPSVELAVVSNGRVVFPQRHCETLPHKTDPAADSCHCGYFTVEDFVILQSISETYQLASHIQRLLNLMSEEFHPTEQSQTTAIAASVLRYHHIPPDPDTATLQKLFRRLDDEIMFEDQSCTGDADFSLEVLLNPVSVTSQRFVPVLKFLSSVFCAKITVYLHPAAVLDSMPLQQYYRAALPELAQTDSGMHLIHPPVAMFHDLPGDKLLTLNPETPSAWLIEPIQAHMDLDNLRLMELQEEVLEVVYGLESILLTGSCIDTTARSREDIYPRGLQLKLGDGRVEVDTLVMSNLGYFQLKANPGQWQLSLAEGRSKELYFIDPDMQQDKSLKFIAHEEEPISLRFLLSSFTGRRLTLRVRKRPGHEAEDVLEAPPQSSADPASPFIDRVLQWVRPREAAPSQYWPSVQAESSNWQDCAFSDDPVNVFTIASGHMYERLQKIMILSVLKNTQSCVKFWFIKNYMSPQIKNFLPHFAKEYKFEYGLITYKWPTWLHHQTEKQRRIWAYKILFLDVLFPLNVRKVLFLDSDQIIRTDIRELYDMDIHGAPLAYTPFCDNNKEMDGFRFWKGGFWQKHLQGKPYHISALYVVDLIRFRQMAAGDQLRIVYEQLSKDPNSLANLDQDLPNYTQHQVPIYSLPQEWLWCESWCGNVTKQAAKTIDLCNNPMTKEPKLQSARRIVSEWSGLDEEAQKLTQLIESLDRPIQPSDSPGHDRTEL